MTSNFDRAAFLTHLCVVNGYRAPRALAGDRYACIAPFAYTTAIIVGRIGDLTGYDDRWCYHTEADARRALETWDGVGEPEGWHRHPGTGRRMSESADERDDAGNRVGAVGLIYVRR